MGNKGNPFEGMSKDELERLRKIEKLLSDEGSSEAQDVVRRIDEQLGED